VEFAPTVAGPANGSLNVTHDGAGSPQSVALSGTGEDPAPTNNAPTCSNDSASATSGMALNDSVTCTDIDVGDTLTYIVVDDVDNGTLSLNTTDGTFTYTSDGGFAGGDTFTFKANDGDADSNVATFTINVSLAPGTILYRVNAGGPEVAAVGGGPNWAQDDGNPNPLHNGVSNDDNWGAPGAVDGTVPETTPSAIFHTERWDPGDPPEMAWDFPVPSGTVVELRLYFRNGYSGTADPGTRTFDVLVDGANVLNDFDISGSVGHDVGTMRSFEVTSDGNIDLDFAHVVENPLINGIEIVVAGAPAQPDVVYRVNANGPSIVLAAGPGWMGDLDGSRSPYAFQGGQNAAGTGDAITPHTSVPVGTPMSIFQTERWDPADAPEMEWQFPVLSGETYEVRLYVAETFVTSNDERVYDVFVEGSLAFNDVDLFETYGHDVGAVLSVEVTMTDTSLDIGWVHVTENTQINGIEIIKLP
jgi:hypothetical protein